MDLSGSGKILKVNHNSMCNVVIVVFRASEGTINYIENISSASLAPFNVCNGCKASSTYLTMYSMVRADVVSTI